MQPKMSVSQKMQEIVRLNDEAIEHLSSLGEGGKSSEGHIQLILDYGTSDDRWEGAKPKTGVYIYAYLLGPSRRHYFDSVDEALEAMKEWHASAMNLTEKDYGW